MIYRGVQRPRGELNSREAGFSVSGINSTINIHGSRIQDGQELQ